MSNKYPSISELTDQIEINRQKMQFLLEKQGIYRWPKEEDFPEWMPCESRFTSEDGKKVAKLAREIVRLKKLRLKSFIGGD